MFTFKRKMVVAGLLLASLIGIGGGVMIYRAMAGKPSGTNAEGEGGPAVPNPQRVPYSTTTPVSADVPLPDNVSMFFPLQTVLILPKYYSPHEPEQIAADRAISRALPEGAAVVTDLPNDYPAAAAAFRKALAQVEKGELRVEPGVGLSALTVGPLLMPYDGVEVQRLNCCGKQLEAEIVYTVKPPSKQWNVKVDSRRPLVVIPLLLRAGVYRLKVTWREVDKIREGKPLPKKPIIQNCSFVAPAGMVESPTLRVHGVDFQALVDGRCPVPGEGQRHSLHLGLRVTNRTEKELLFKPSSVGLLADSLRGVDGDTFRYQGGSDGTILAKPIRVPANWSHLFIVRGNLGWFKDYPHREAAGYKGGTGLYLSGMIGMGERFWYYDGLAVGKHRVCFDYHHTMTRPEPAWTGHVRTQDATFEIVP